MWVWYSACVQFAHAAYELTLLTTLIKKSEVVKIELKYFLYYVKFILTEKKICIDLFKPILLQDLLFSDVRITYKIRF